MTTFDAEVDYYQKEVRQFAQDQFDNLTYRERLFVGAQAMDILNDLRKINPYCRLTLQDVLVLALYACYYMKFHESPVETAILHR